MSLTILRSIVRIDVLEQVGCITSREGKYSLSQLIVVSVQCWYIRVETSVDSTSDVDTICILQICDYSGAAGYVHPSFIQFHLDYQEPLSQRVRASTTMPVYDGHAVFNDIKRQLDLAGIDDPTLGAEPAIRYLMNRFDIDVEKLEATMMGMNDSYSVV